jgi:hypothetical protein
MRNEAVVAYPEPGSALPEFSLGGLKKTLETLT